jgi:hypothetical protein
MLSDDIHVTSHTNSASGLPGGPRRPDGEIDVEITAVRSEGHINIAMWETDSIGSQAKIIKTTVMSTEWGESEVRKGKEDRCDCSHERW